MASRAKDWFRQAEREGRHEWACFAAHQASEKAVNALHLSRGQEAWGHVVARLLVELPVQVSEDKGKLLRSG